MKKKHRARRYYVATNIREETEFDLRERAWAVIDHYLEKYQHELNLSECSGVAFDREMEIQRQLRCWLADKELWERLGGQIPEYLEDYYIKYLLKMVPYCEKYHQALEEVRFPKPGINDCPPKDIVRH
jgi:hypothetical protein